MLFKAVDQRDDDVLLIRTVQTLGSLAHAHAVRGDHEIAATLLRDCRVIVDRSMRGSGARLAAVPDAHSDESRTAVGPAPHLTPAELRLLPLLTTHMSFREIGEVLFLSRHTIKSQTMSIYRKLGVNARSDAIARMAGLRTADAESA